MPTQVDTPISTLSDQEIAAYLGSKGSPLPQEIIDDPDLLEFFMKPIRSDYACLESYTDEPNADSVSSSVVVLGGELDTGIPVDKLETWTNRFKEIFHEIIKPIHRSPTNKPHINPSSGIFTIMNIFTRNCQH